MKAHFFHSYIILHQSLLKCRDLGKNKKLGPAPGGPSASPLPGETSTSAKSQGQVSPGRDQMVISKHQNQRFYVYNPFLLLKTAWKPCFRRRWHHEITNLWDHRTGCLVWTEDEYPLGVSIGRFHWERNWRFTGGSSWEYLRQNGIEMKFMGYQYNTCRKYMEIPHLRDPRGYLKWFVIRISLPTPKDVYSVFDRMQSTFSLQTLSQTSHVYFRDKQKLGKCCASMMPTLGPPTASAPLDISW